MQSESFDVLTKFVSKPEVCWGITPYRLINIYQSVQLNNPQSFSVWTADFIKTARNETNTVSTIGVYQYGNAPSGRKEAKELYDYLNFYQFRKKTTIVCFEHLRREYT